MAVCFGLDRTTIQYFLWIIQSNVLLHVTAHNKLLTLWYNISLDKIFQDNGHNTYQIRLEILMRFRYKRQQSLSHWQWYRIFDILYHYAFFIDNSHKSASVCCIIYIESNVYNPIVSSCICSCVWLWLIQYLNWLKFEGSLSITATGISCIAICSMLLHSIAWENYVSYLEISFAIWLMHKWWVLFGYSIKVLRTDILLQTSTIILSWWHG